MAGLLDFGTDEEQKRQNLGLLALLAGAGISQANQPGASMGQAVGAGLGQGAQGLMQMQQLQQRANLQQQQMQLAQDRLVPNSVREYEYAKSQGFQGSFEDYRNQVMGRNEVPASIREWQAFNALPKEDQARYLNMKRANNYQNFGGFMGLPNPAVPGTFQAVVDKTPPPEQMPDFKGAQASATATGRVQGETQATAAVNLPQTVAQGEDTIKLIDDIVNHPGMPGVIGMPESASGVTNYLFGKPLPGTKEADFRARLDQLQGKQFLQAYETLKGGGQITEIEGAKAQDAISRMTKTGQSEEEFRKAAKEFQDIIRAGVNRAKLKAGVKPPTGAPGGWSIQRVD